MTKPAQEWRWWRNHIQLWWQPWDALTDPRWCPNRFIYACHVCERPWPLVQFQKLVWGQSCYDNINMVAAVGTCFTWLFLPNPRPCACILPLLESKYGQSMLLLCQLSRNGGQNRGCQWLPLTDTDSNMAHLKSERDIDTWIGIFIFCNNYYYFVYTEPLQHWWCGSYVYHHAFTNIAWAKCTQYLKITWLNVIAFVVTHFSLSNPSRRICLLTFSFKESNFCQPDPVFTQKSPDDPSGEKYGIVTVSLLRYKMIGFCVYLSENGIKCTIASRVLWDILLFVNQLAPVCVYDEALNWWRVCFGFD